MQNCDTENANSVDTDSVHQVEAGNGESTLLRYNYNKLCSNDSDSEVKQLS